MRQPPTQSGAPHPPFRFQLGLLLLGLPRRFIPPGLRDLPPSGADEPVSNPVGQAGPRQPGGLPYQCVVVRHHPNPYRGRVDAVFFFSRSGHGSEVYAPRGHKVN